MIATQAIAPPTNPLSILFPEVPRGPQDKLSCISSVEDFAPQASIFYEGDPCRHLFEVLEGVLRVYKLTPDGRRQVTGFLYPGQVLGLGFMESYAYTAEAVTAVKLCRYKRDSLDRVMDDQPALARRLLTITASELATAQDQMLLLGRKTASERIASFLLRLSDHNAEIGEDPAEVYLPMTRTDIGDYLGLTTETVSRTISRFKARGLIRLRPAKRVQLLDLDALAELAEGDEAPSGCAKKGW